MDSHPIRGCGVRNNFVELSSVSVLIKNRVPVITPQNCVINPSREMNSRADVASLQLLVRPSLTDFSRIIAEVVTSSSPEAISK